MKTIGVFFGSRSPEHDVSIVTGQLIISELKKLGYSVIPVYISKTGKWFIGEELGSLKFFTQPNFEEQLKSVPQFYLDLEESFGKKSLKQKGLLGKKIHIDLAFPAFHGSYGEDGTIQGLFEMFNIPYVGCDVTASAITMDKILTKQICQASGIPTAEYVFHTKQEWIQDKTSVLSHVKKNLSWPVMIKPAHLGSSIGITKASTEKELEHGLEVGFHYDNKVLIERCIENLADLTCAVLGNDELTPSVLQESTFGKEFFSYEDKYIADGGAQLGNATKNLKIPADLDEKTIKEIQQMALKTFKALGCSGISRVDFLYDRKAKKYYVSEVNPLPGTLYHHLWIASGLPIDKLITKLIALAEEKHAEKASIQHTFQNDLLKFANSVKLQMKQ